MDNDDHLAWSALAIFLAVGVALEWAPPLGCAIIGLLIGCRLLGWVEEGGYKVGRIIAVLVVTAAVGFYVTDRQSNSAALGLMLGWCGGLFAGALGIIIRLVRKRLLVKIRS